MTLSRCATALLASALVACGGSTVVDGGSGGAGSSTSSSSSGVSTSSGNGNGGGGAGGMGGGGDGGGGSGGGSPGPWRADMWIGQIDHMAIRHLDVEQDVCFLFSASAPGGQGSYEATIPSPWGLHMISAWDDTTGCMDETFTPQEPSASAAAATGSISFELTPMQVYPCELDVDVQVTFDAPPSWLQSSYVLQTSMLEVQGACP